jgi:hypothetical protein
MALAVQLRRPEAEREAQGGIIARARKVDREVQRIMQLRAGKMPEQPDRRFRRRDMQVDSFAADRGRDVIMRLAIGGERLHIGAAILRIGEARLSGEREGRALPGEGRTEGERADRDFGRLQLEIRQAEAGPATGARSTSSAPAVSAITSTSRRHNAAGCHRSSRVCPVSQTPFASLRVTAANVMSPGKRPPSPEICTCGPAKRLICATAKLRPAGVFRPKYTAGTTASTSSASVPARLSRSSGTRLKTLPPTRHRARTSRCRRRG